MFKSLINVFGGDPNAKAIAAYSEIVDAINALEEPYEALSTEALQAKTTEFKTRLAEGESLEDLMVEAFATVREASKRVLGMRHYDVQLIGGIVLHEGQVAEMRTGEGKTLMATLPIYLNALSGQGVHLITVNDYLARRDARWMAPIFYFLGLNLGVLQMGSRTEGGKKAFLVDLELENAQEDQHQLALVDRQEAYSADITYGTNSEFGFDYLRDNMTLSLAARSQRGHHYAIIDEVDNVLIDEARTPLIISGPSYDDAENYEKMAKVVKQLNPVDFEVEEKDRTVTLTEIGEVHVEQIMGQPMRDPERPEDVTPEQARLLGYLEQALRAEYLYRRNKDYLVQGGKVIIIDEFTGRLMPGRRWSDGLHQAVEAKEGVKVEAENVTHATITIQNYFRMYEKLAGMTGTALTEAEEFADIYKLEVVAIPPNVEYNAMRPDAPLVELKAKDEYGYEYTYYSESEEKANEPLFWKRKDYPDVIYRTVEAKLRSLVQEIIAINALGRPILVGTTSVENSDRLSTRLQLQWVRKLAQVLLLRSYWMQQNNREEDGRLIMALSFLYAPLENLDSGQLNSLAKELGINLNPDTPENIQQLLYILGLESAQAGRLEKILKNGIPHQVLNARKHTEESQIIAGAGAFGAVTIATNMAGRGVDIKLGGEVAEEILSAVNRVLRRSNVEEPYEMTLEERLEAVQQLKDEDLGIYKSEIQYFIQSMADMEKVKELGGLHVIGSERHDARRIDNQLRGRAARQGDPGSSRFYLSLEDDLMRLFGGQQVDGLMQRLGMDDALPLEHGIVSRVVEQSQTRVEGANFDARKHLLEYDDVLNSQRVTIYSQRDRIFTKEELDEDVNEMLTREVEARIAALAEDDEAAWKLLAWLEQIQPTQVIGNVFIPSFMYNLLLQDLEEKANDKANTKAALIEIAEGSLNAEENHVKDAALEILASNQDWLETQLEERLDVLEIFIEALGYADETETRGPKELFDEVQALVRVPLTMGRSEQRQLQENPDEALELLSKQVEQQLTQQAAIRVSGAVDRRLNAELGLNTKELAEMEWDVLAQTVNQAVDAYFNSQRESLLGKDKLDAELDTALNRIDGQDYHVGHLLQLLLGMQQGTQIGFNPRTKRREERRYVRFRYFFHAAELLGRVQEKDLQERVLSHLQRSLLEMKRGWGFVSMQQAGSTAIAMLPKKTRQKLEDRFGAEGWNNLKTKTLGQLDAQQDSEALALIGERELTEAHRAILLRAISEHWIEYLTKMEALRVSIGLEAYGQRDPLVQYKAQASQMFSQLIQDIRTQVVNRMFNLQPRAAQLAPAPSQSNGQSAASNAQDAAVTQPTKTEKPQPLKSSVADNKGSDKKKKRRRRR